MQLSVGVSYNDITSETTFGIVIQPYGARRGGGLDGLGSSQFSGVYGGGGGVLSGNLNPAASRVCPPLSPAIQQAPFFFVRELRFPLARSSTSLRRIVSFSPPGAEFSTAIR